MDSMRDRLYPLSERASLLALTRREGQALQRPQGSPVRNPKIEWPSQRFSNPECFGRRSGEPVPCCRVG
jgi:hypothetical protein